MRAWWRRPAAGESASDHDLGWVLGSRDGECAWCGAGEDGHVRDAYSAMTGDGARGRWCALWASVWAGCYLGLWQCDKVCGRSLDDKWERGTPSLVNV